MAKAGVVRGRGRGGTGSASEVWGERHVTWTPRDGLREGGWEQMGTAPPFTLFPRLSSSRVPLLPPPTVPLSLGAVWTGAELKGVGPALPRRPSQLCHAPHEEASEPPSS